MSTQPTFNFVVISPPGAPVDFVTGINDIGQIAGWVQGMGFIYTSGAYTTFSVGGPIQVTGDINNLEQVVGYSHGSGPGGDQGFLYSSGTVTRVNDPLAGIFGTDPSGINDSGQIVGTYYGPAAGAPVRGFLYDSGTYADIVDPLTASAGGTHASGINNSGQIVGYYYDGSGVAHGFLYNGSNYATLDEPLATGGTYLTAINNTGQVVGYYKDASGQHGL